MASSSAHLAFSAGSAAGEGQGAAASCVGPQAAALSRPASEISGDSYPTYAAALMPPPWKSRRVVGGRLLHAGLGVPGPSPFDTTDSGARYDALERRVCELEGLVARLRSNESLLIERVVELERSERYWDSMLRWLWRTFQGAVVAWEWGAEAWAFRQANRQQKGHGKGQERGDSEMPDDPDMEQQRLSEDVEAASVCTFAATAGTSASNHSGEL